MNELLDYLMCWPYAKKIDFLSGLYDTSRRILKDLAKEYLAIDDNVKLDDMSDFENGIHAKYSVCDKDLNATDLTKKCDEILSKWEDIARLLKDETDIVVDFPEQNMRYSYKWNPKQECFDETVGEISHPVAEKIEHDDKTDSSCNGSDKKKDVCTDECPRENQSHDDDTNKDAYAYGCLCENKSPMQKIADKIKQEIYNYANKTNEKTEDSCEKTYSTIITDESDERLQFMPKSALSILKDLIEDECIQSFFNIIYDDDNKISGVSTSIRPLIRESESDKDYLNVINHIMNQESLMLDRFCQYAKEDLGFSRVLWYGDYAYDDMNNSVIAPYIEDIKFNFYF